jgi:nucleoside-diphosphate-sugar epimerase
VARPATRPGDLVLVTGATGRIGANLCRALLGRGYRVRTIVLPDDPSRAKLDGLDLEVVTADLRDPAPVAAACAGADAICHLAALIGGPDTVGMSTADYWHANVDATLHVLEGARRNERVVRFVYASSDATYPTSNPRYSPVDEGHPQEPVNLYGLTKVVGERMSRDYMVEYALSVTILRYGGVYTPDERATVDGVTLAAHRARLRDAKRSHDNYLWANVRDHERPWEYLEPLGESDELVALVDDQGRPWQTHLTDVRDAVQASLLALECAAAGGESFNIHGPAPVSSVELVRHLADRFDRPWRAVALPFRQAVEVSTAKARALLGYRPAYDVFRSIDDGLAMQQGEEIGVVPARPPPRREVGGAP